MPSQFGPWHVLSGGFCRIGKFPGVFELLRIFWGRLGAGVCMYESVRSIISGYLKKKNHWGACSSFTFEAGDLRVGSAFLVVFGVVP